MEYDGTRINRDDNISVAALHEMKRMNHVMTLKSTHRQRSE